MHSRHDKIYVAHTIFLRTRPAKRPTQTLLPALFEDQVREGQNTKRRFLWAVEGSCSHASS